MVRFSKYQPLNNRQVAVLSEMENGRLKIDVMILKPQGDDEPIAAESVQVQVQSRNQTRGAMNMRRIDPNRSHLVETHSRGSIAHYVIVSDSESDAVDDLEFVDVSFGNQQARFVLDQVMRNTDDPKN